MRRSTHRYGDHASQVVDLWRGPGARGVAVVVHGGSWRQRRSRFTTDALCADLAARGWWAWNIEYRRMGAGGGCPATFDDAAAAVDLLHAMAGRPDGPVVAIGHSAGGTLALWLGGRRDAMVAVTAVASLAGVPRMAMAAHDPNGRAVVDLMGGLPADVPQHYAFGDPEALLPLGVPLLLVHGDADRTVPVAQSQTFAALAREAGDVVEMVTVAGGDHHSFVRPRSLQWQPVRDWLDTLA